MDNYGNPRKKFHREDSVPTTTQRLIEMLDHVEKRVKLYREQAMNLKSEREALHSILSTIRTSKDLERITEGEKEEILLTAERLRKRIIGVEITVTVPRDEFQEKALDKVIAYLKELNFLKESGNIERAKQVALTYYNACLSESRGPIDQKFQSVIIECTAEDQKETRNRLDMFLKTEVQ